jgi:hypothetical protein
MPLLLHAVEQYLRINYLIVVSSLESDNDRRLVEHLLEPAMYLCLQGFLFNFGILYM